MVNLLALAHTRLTSAFAAVRDREEGQGLVEYVVLVAAVAAMVVTLVTLLTTSLSTYITDLIDNLPVPGG